MLREWLRRQDEEVAATGPALVELHGPSGAGRPVPVIRRARSTGVLPPEPPLTGADPVGRLAELFRRFD
jgi:hypothetical protein